MKKHLAGSLPEYKLSFTDLQVRYLNSESEKEKKFLIRMMRKKASSFEEWLFVFGHSSEKRIRYKAEKKVVKAAHTVPNLVIVIQNYNLTREREIVAIEKALIIASDNEFRDLKQLCAEKGMMVHYLDEKANRAMNAACC